MAHINRKEYWIIFAWLTVLTVLEVGLVYIPGIGKVPMVIGLFSMALTKAALVGLFFMHLRHETRILKLNIAIPMAIPMFYALVLVTEALWRKLP